ncbi:MAG: pilus assembly protein TadG-related protein [Desulfobulbus sp.]|jgi:hypothetical protein
MNWTNRTSERPGPVRPRGTLLQDEQGAISVASALLITVLLVVMAGVIDTGYLYLEKTRYRNAAEGAALDAVRRLNEGDWEETARNAARDAGLPVDQVDGEGNPLLQILVETGLYDEYNEFNGSLGGEFRYFTNAPPDNRPVNAVHVRFRRTLPSLTRMSPPARIMVEAVAYLRQLDMVSLDPDGSIRLGHESRWENAMFYANGDIQLAESATRKGSTGMETYAAPEFTNCLLLAAGEIESCPVKVKPGSWWSPAETLEIQWNRGTSHQGENTRSDMERLTDIRPVDQETLDLWQDRADKVYTPDSRDEILYRYNQYPLPGEYCFDLSAAEPDSVIFFDSRGNKARIDPFCRRPAGYLNPNPVVRGITFVSTGPVTVFNGSSTETPVHYGGEDEDQVRIIAKGKISVYPKSGGASQPDGTWLHGSQLDGVVFRTGEDFNMQDDIMQSGHVIGSGRSSSLSFRVIADGSIAGGASVMGYSPTTIGGLYGLNTESGVFAVDNDSRFAPPCEPAMAGLGSLERLP